MTKGTQEIVSVLKKHPDATLADMKKLLKRKVSGRSLGDARRELNGIPAEPATRASKPKSRDPFAAFKAIVKDYNRTRRIIDRIREIVGA